MEHQRLITIDDLTTSHSAMNKAYRITDIKQPKKRGTECKICYDIFYKKDMISCNECKNLICPNCYEYQSKFLVKNLHDTNVMNPYLRTSFECPFCRTKTPSIIQDRHDNIKAKFYDDISREYTSLFMEYVKSKYVIEKYISNMYNDNSSYKILGYLKDDSRYLVIIKIIGGETIKYKTMIDTTREKINKLYKLDKLDSIDENEELTIDTLTQEQPLNKQKFYITMKQFRECQIPFDNEKVELLIQNNKNVTGCKEINNVKELYKKYQAFDRHKRNFDLSGRIDVSKILRKDNF